MRKIGVTKGYLHVLHPLTARVFPNFASLSGSTISKGLGLWEPRGYRTGMHHEERIKMVAEKGVEPLTRRL